MNSLVSTICLCLVFTRNIHSTFISKGVTCTEDNVTDATHRQEVMFNWSDFTVEMSLRNEHSVNFVSLTNESQEPPLSLSSVPVSRHFRYFIHSMIDPCVKRVTVNVIPNNVCYFVDVLATAFNKSIFTRSCSEYWLSSLTISQSRLNVADDSLARSAFNLARRLLNHYTLQSLNVGMNMLYLSPVNTLALSSSPSASTIDGQIELHRSNFTGETGMTFTLSLPRTSVFHLFKDSVQWRRRFSERSFSRESQ